ncbi:MAG: AAA-like domain-containing protein [Elainella sp. C42_A2020_010]|nr:AAA-like domain-containing protein [Elainella sp. C42_A2020_010]
MELDLERAIATADQALFDGLGRHLSDVETEILRGAWQGFTYDQIAEVSGYSDSYLRRDVGNKLWRSLSQALGETVSKTDFREALQRYLIQHPTQNLPQVHSANHQALAAENGNRDAPEQTASTAALTATGLTTTALASTVPSTVPSTIVETAQPAIYVARPPIEAICYDTLLQPGSLVRIKAPALMGKTLLMEHTLAQLSTQALRTVILSFELADRKAHFSDLDRFLRWFCVNISRELGMPNQIETYWDEAGMGSKASCTSYVEEYLLAADDRPLVLCLDDVDLLFPYPEIYEDFFGLLRSWYEKARRRMNWKKLRLCIVHATDVYIQLNINQSPFNIGVPLNLPEFNPSQILDLAQQHHLLADIDLTPLIHLVGGHPYLLELAFLALKSHPNLSLENLIQSAPTEAGIYANHLRECWLRIRGNSDLTHALNQVMRATQPIQMESVQAYQLQSMGLIRLQGNQAAPRCPLYRQYFNAQLQQSLE